MSLKSYSIVMFAYNEEVNIRRSINSIFDNSDNRLESLYVIANGCKDNTVKIVNELKNTYTKINLVDITLGDKCNAWNIYIHEIAPNCNVHFFTDADVQFTKNVFPMLFDKLITTPQSNAIAGIPVSGRNIDYYKNLVINNSCLFGGCHGLKNEFVELIREKNFKLPVGLSWIDSAITKAVNSDIGDQNSNLPNRITYLLDSGYTFDSLNPFKISDLKLYWNRLARYKTGRLQENYLKSIDFCQWPDNLEEINSCILNEIKSKKMSVPFLLKGKIIKRLTKKLS